MDGNATQVAVVGLTRAEALDLRRSLKNIGGIEAVLEESDTDEASAGVLVETTVVLPLGSMAISGLTAWLLKNRSSTTIKQRIEIRRANGEVEVRELEIEHDEAITGESIAGVLKALQQPATP